MSVQQDVRIEDVRVGERRLPLRPATVEQLVASIRDVGLLHPIVVNQSGDGLVLVAGLHRLAACRELGMATIPATLLTASDVEARLAELDENLIRQELTAQERGLLMAERKALYDVRHPQAREEAKKAAGMRRGGQANSKKTQVGAPRAPTSPEPPTFTQDTAAKTGRSERTVQEDVQIGTKIVPEAHAAIEGTPIADQKKELLDLSRVPPELQPEVARKVADGEAKTVNAAVAQASREQMDGMMAAMGATPSPVESMKLPFARARAKLSSALTDLGNLDVALVAQGLTDDDVATLERYALRCHQFVERIHEARPPRIHLVT